MIRFKLFFSLAIFMLAATNIHAELVGTLVLEKGFVKIRRNFIDTIYKDTGKQIPVHEKDEIQTGINTLVQVNIDKDGKDETITLYSVSFFTVSNVTKEKSEVFLPAGKAKFKIKRLELKKRSRRFRLRSTNALIGVKGTEFVIGVSGGDTNLLTLEGAVSMASIAAPEIEVEIPQYQASQIKQNKRPTAPVFVPPEVRKKIVEADSPEVFKSVTFGKEVKATKTKKKKKKKKTKKKAGKKDKKKDKKEVKKKEKKAEKEEKKEEVKETKEEKEEQAEEEEAEEEEEEEEEEEAEEEEVVEEEEEVEEPELSIDEIVAEVTESIEEVSESLAEIIQTEKEIRFKINDKW
ncbi:MAG: FecR domain-containing protein [Proteobacteria bacterium]|nr:FecR domain-containing protein [Pseudomonadota bacterium]